MMHLSRQTVNDKRETIGSYPHLTTSRFLLNIFIPN